jgi:hypothetical protein
MGRFKAVGETIGVTVTTAAFGISAIHAGVSLSLNANTRHPNKVSKDAGGKSGSPSPSFPEGLSET